MLLLNPIWHLTIFIESLKPLNAVSNVHNSCIENTYFLACLSDRGVWTFCEVAITSFPFLRSEEGLQNKFDNILIFWLNWWVTKSQTFIKLSPFGLKPVYLPKKSFNTCTHAHEHYHQWLSLYLSSQHLNCPIQTLVWHQVFGTIIIAFVSQINRIFLPNNNTNKSTK